MYYFQCSRSVDFCRDKTGLFFCFLFFGLAERILVPQLGMELMPPALRTQVLTTGPPRKSQQTSLEGEVGMKEGRARTVSKGQTLQCLLKHGDELGLELKVTKGFQD